MEFPLSWILELAWRRHSRSHLPYPISHPNLVTVTLITITNTDTGTYINQWCKLGTYANTHIRHQPPRCSSCRILLSNKFWLPQALCHDTSASHHSKLKLFQKSQSDQKFLIQVSVYQQQLRSQLSPQRDETRHVDTSVLLDCFCKHWFCISEQ